MNGFDLLFPAPARLPVVLALAATTLLMIGLGRVVSGSRRPAIALFVGWGAAVFAFVLGGTLLTVSFRILAGLLLVPALAGLVLLARERLGDRPAWSRAGRILLLALPLILIVAGMRASQWDDLDHWLPNGHFLAAHDRFPSAAQPSPFSSWPAYPYALPLISYLAGLLSGGFSDVAGILFNLVLLIASAWMIGDIIADHRTGSAPQADPSRLALWGSAAVALLLAIPLNPSFVTKLSFTNYSDSATSCVLAAAAVVALLWLDAAFARRRERFALAVAAGCVLTILVGLRQANLALFGLVIGGFGLSLLLEGKLFDRRSLSGLLALPMPVVAAWLWQRYAAAEMPSGAFRFLPWARWHFDQIAQIAGTMWSVMLSKGGHFGLMAALGILALATLARPALLDLRARILCRTVLVLLLGYTGFLLLAYVSLFQGSEATGAASFWRYSTHLGMLGIVAAVQVVVGHWRLRPSLSSKLGVAAIALAVLVPLAAVKFIRFDIEHPHDGFLLAVSRDLLDFLPAGARLDLLDPRGSFSDMALVRYHLLFDRGRDPAAASAVHVTIDVDAVQRAAARTGAGDYIWLAEGGPEMREIFGQELPAGAGYLLEHQAEGYRLIRAWPDSRATEIFHAADFR